MREMIFKYTYWAEFCSKLQENGLVSIPACMITETKKKYIVLKHDVETDVIKAFELAKIENKYGHKGSYYVQAYLLKNEKNISLLKQMKKMGHEISYHYDVMDSCNGDLPNAIKEFEQNKRIFENNGFPIITVCQHGNPVIERIGYTSNRDFFRDSYVQEQYKEIADIMVNYKEKYHTEYTYYSDAGRRFTMIFDPINNDRINSDDKNITYDNLNELYNAIQKDENAIVSIHPHRWTRTATEYIIKAGLFKTIRYTAKLLLHIPGMRKLFGKYYYLAKKI